MGETYISFDDVDVPFSRLRADLRELLKAADVVIVESDTVDSHVTTRQGSSGRTASGDSDTDHDPANLLGLGDQTAEPDCRFTVFGRRSQRYAEARGKSDQLLTVIIYVSTQDQALRLERLYDQIDRIKGCCDGRPREQMDYQECLLRTLHQMQPTPTEGDALVYEAAGDWWRKQFCA